MRITTALILFITPLIFSCKTSIKLAIPPAFEQQANMQHVSGARGNKMKMDNYTISKIKRGIHISYPGWSRGFLLENILLNQIGLEKKENVIKERAKFRYSISNGSNVLDIFGMEQQLYNSIEYKALNKVSSIFNSWERIQGYRYIFTVVIHSDAPGTKDWELVMSNIYERKKDTVNSFFTIIRPNESGMATNGKDTFYIKPLFLKKVESDRGIASQLPFKVLSAYEVNTSDGLVAIIDLIDRNIWFYNELDASDKLIITAIGTSIFARKVSDTNW